MRKISIKFIALFLIAGLNWFGLSAIGQTWAYFNDTETVSVNSFEAGILDMTLRSGQNNFVPNAENMMAGDQANRDIYVGKTANSLPLKHRVSYEFIDGNESFCNQLDLEIWYDHYKCQGSYADCRDMRLKYNDSLISLNNLIDSDFIIPHPDDQFDTDDSDGTEQWFFYSIVVPDNINDSFQGEVCKFNFVFEAWQDNIENYEDGGFTDTEEIESIIKVDYWNPPVVLNEFLPNADNYPEFVELYNNSDDPIDLAGYKIKVTRGKIPIISQFTSMFSGGSTIIGPKSWLVVAPLNTVNPVTNMMGDNAGTVTLYNPNNVIVDSYTYGSPDHNINNTPGWTNNLVGYWPFDGDTQDLSGNGNHGTNYGAEFDDGKINQGLSFDGGDNVVVNNSCSLKPGLVTLEAWVKKSGSPGSYKYIAGKYYSGGYGSYNLYTGAAGGLKFYIGHSGGFVASPDAGTGIWDGNWHHIVGTYDGSDVRLYVDSVEVGSGVSTSVNIAYNTNNFYIGSYGNGYYFDGDIDEVKLYGRALDTTEICEHYNDVSTPSGSVPVDKSFARIPDGIGSWVDPIPTPGAPNILESESVVWVEPIVPAVSEEELEEESEEEPVVEESITEEEVIEEEPIDTNLGTGEEIIKEIVEEIEQVIDVIEEAFDEIFEEEPAEEPAEEIVEPEPAEEPAEEPLVEESITEEEPVIEKEEIIIEEEPEDIPSEEDETDE